MTVDVRALVQESAAGDQKTQNMNEKQQEVTLARVVTDILSPNISVSGVAFGSRVPVASVEQCFFNRELECSCNRFNTEIRVSCA